MLVAAFRMQYFSLRKRAALSLLKVRRRRFGRTSKLKLFRGIAKKNCGTEKDGGGDIKIKERLREAWNQLPDDEFPGVLKSRYRNSERKTDPCPRAGVVQMEKMPRQH